MVKRGRTINKCAAFIWGLVWLLHLFRVPTDGACTVLLYSWKHVYICIISIYTLRKIFIIYTYVCLCVRVYLVWSHAFTLGWLHRLHPHHRLFGAEHPNSPGSCFSVMEFFTGEGAALGIRPGLPSCPVVTPWACDLQETPGLLAGELKKFRCPMLQV